MAATPPPVHIATETDAQRLAAEGKRRAAEAKKLEAAEEQIRQLTNRLKRVERVVRGLITSKTLSDAQRPELIGLLAGTRTSTIEPHLVGYTPAEQRLVQHYRAMSAGAMQTISRLASQMARLQELEQKGEGA